MTEEEKLDKLDLMAWSANAHREIAKIQENEMRMLPHLFTPEERARKEHLIAHRRRIAKNLSDAYNNLNDAWFPKQKWPA
jgi:hypothetical protein